MPMQPHDPPEIVYHGTDAESAKSIRQIGLNDKARNAAGGGCGVDEKGFSVTTNRQTAVDWAKTRATERGGPPEGVVLEADASALPLQSGSPGEWADADEYFIYPEDFGQVGP